jgi:hypothetical protein
VAGQLPLEEPDVTTETRPAGYHRAALVNELDGGMCDDCDSTCPRCEKARTLVDNHAAEVQAARDEQFAAWLVKKAREYRSTGSQQHALQADAIELLADKLRRGAVR